MALSKQNVHENCLSKRQARIQHLFARCIYGPFEEYMGPAALFLLKKENCHFLLFSLSKIEMNK